MREDEVRTTTQSFRRRAGRDQQRREHHLSRRLQTNRHDRARAKNGDCDEGGNHSRGARPPRSLCPAAGGADGRSDGGARPLRSRLAAAGDCPSANGMTTGSSLWQMIFISFALVLILFEVVRGWRLGVVRQVVRLVALVAAYAAAIFGGRMLLPALASVPARPRLLHFDLRRRDPRSRRLRGHQLRSARFSSNAPASKAPGSCACFTEFAERRSGIFFGLFSVWLVVVAIRSVGAIASANLHTETIAQHAAGAADRSPATFAQRSDDDRLARQAEELDRTGVVRRSGQGGRCRAGADLPDARQGRDRLVSNPQSARTFSFLPRGRGS